jgi:hypothetical protein
MTLDPLFVAKRVAFLSAEKEVRAKRGLM